MFHAFVYRPQSKIRFEIEFPGEESEEIIYSKLWKRKVLMRKTLIHKQVCIYLVEEI